MPNRLKYWRRILEAYLFSKNSALTFWHERPAVNPDARFDGFGPYYMTFSDKAALAYDRTRLAGEMLEVLDQYAKIHRPELIPHETASQKRV